MTRVGGPASIPKAVQTHAVSHPPGSPMIDPKTFDSEADAWWNSPYTGVMKMVHVVIARIANHPNQWRIWAGDNYLAEYVGCSKRTIIRTKQQMIEDGLLRENGFDAKTGNREYVYLIPGTRDMVSPVPESETSLTGGEVTSCPPEVTSGPSEVTSTTSAPITNETDSKGLESFPPSAVALSVVADDGSLTPVGPDPVPTFDDFWDAYPKRNGKREGKAKCIGLWKRPMMTPEVKIACVAGVRLYADALAAGHNRGSARDPERWLKHQGWLDWEEPADVTEAAGGGRGYSDPLRSAHPKPTIMDGFIASTGGTP